MTTLPAPILEAAAALARAGRPVRALPSGRLAWQAADGTWAVLVDEITAVGDDAQPPKYCRACENVAGNFDPIQGDPGGLCWPCYAKYRPVVCAGCADSIPAMHAIRDGFGRLLCEGCVEDMTGGN